MSNPYSLEDVQKVGTWVDVDRTVVREVPLPKAGDRPRWIGIKHSDLLDALLVGFNTAGLKTTAETWTLSGFGERLFGYIDISLDEDRFIETKEALSLPDEISYDDFAFEDIQLRLGLRHSNDSSTALYFMVAPQVKVNGAAITVDRGNISLNRRHTKGTAQDEESLQTAVDKGIKTFLTAAAQLDQEIKMFKSIKLTKEIAHHVMVGAATKKIIPWASIKQVDKFFGDGTSAWDLYLAFSRTGGNYFISREMQIVTKSRKLILQMCNQEVEVIKAAEEDTTTEVILKLDDETQKRMVEAEGGVRAYAPKELKFADMVF